MARYHDTPTRKAAKSTENRQNYSLYQPVNKRKSSVSKQGDKAQKDRDSVTSRMSADPPGGRRRGTIRSKEHDDEEAQIARAIEESKREVGTGKGGKRSGKRERDDTEE